jgi:hypothetical protein
VKLHIVEKVGIGIIAGAFVGMVMRPGLAAIIVELIGIATLLFGQQLRHSKR